MPRSTWDGTEQHCPPQLLLRPFKKKGSSSHIWCHDRQTGRLSSEKISKVARQPHLMTVEDDRTLRGIEQRASDALAKLYKRRFNEFNESDRKAVDQLVVALMYNHPSWVPVKERIRWEVIDEKVVASALNASLGGRSLNVPAAYGLLDAVASRNYLDELVSNGRSQVLLGLRSMRLTVHGPPPGESFVIGDYPVVELPSGRHWLFRFPFFQGQVVLPIRHDLVLVYSAAAVSNLVDADDRVTPEFLQRLDQIYFGSSPSRFVYGRTAESLSRWVQPRQRVGLRCGESVDA